MVADAAARAVAPDAREPEREAALAVIAHLSGTESNYKARIALERVASSTTVATDVRGDAALLARMMSADEGTESGARVDRKLGVVESLSILGPVRDTGGGLDTHDGPEDAKAFFAPGERYSWGAYDVAWRAVPSPYATASGVPLDLFVSPRKESCTWVATWLTVDKPQPLVLRVASTGQVRVVFDGANVVRDEHVHALARFDRVAGRVDAEAGGHLFAAKVCSGAPDDDGRVRLRVTDANGGWPAGVTAGPWTGALHPKKVKSSALPTPLERALEPTSKDAEARLDAGILQTLGGADDLRSPRASGLLVSLVDGGLDLDRVAMAAWVAPSGANRSAWLNRVRQGSDAPARAFAERRLVERHLDAGLADWAMASLRGAGIDQAPDAEAALLAARVEMALGTDALRVRALHRLEQAADSLGDAAPDLLLQWLTQVGAGLDPQRTRATWEKIAQRAIPGGDYVRAVGSADGRAAVVAAAKRAFAGGLENADDALEAAQAVAQAGAHEEARALFEELGRWSPNRSGVWTGVAQEVGGNAGRRDERRVDHGGVATGKGARSR